MSLAHRRDVVRVCRLLYERGLIAGGEGNVSLRLGPDHLLMTPRGLAKGSLRPEDLVEVSMTGAARRGHRLPSSEVALHLELYRSRADVQAVVHAHPPTATGFAAAGLGIPDDALPEVTFGLGPVALVPYARPGSTALADAVRERSAAHDVLLLSNHGAVTVGVTLEVAYQRMESLEHAAQILLVARQLGGPARLSADEVLALAAERRRERPGAYGTGGTTRSSGRSG
jgi:L-fuculose-phosphate aldolase